MLSLEGGLGGVVNKGRVLGKVNFVGVKGSKFLYFSFVIKVFNSKQLTFYESSIAKHRL